MKWFVQRMLRADDLDPQPEPLARGGLAHAALKDTLAGLRERSGSARLTPEHGWVSPRSCLREALRGREAEFPLSAVPERRRGVRRRLEADLERYLEHAAECESPLEPTYLELGFGFGEEQERRRSCPARLACARPWRWAEAARADRPRRSGPGGSAGGRVRLQGPQRARSGEVDEQGNVQVALYMRAVEELLGLEAAGGFYQPLSGADLRARGVLDGESGVELECVRGEAREHAAVSATAHRTPSRRRGRPRAGGARRARAPPSHMRVSGRLHVSDDLPVRAMKNQLSFDEIGFSQTSLVEIAGAQRGRDGAGPRAHTLTDEQEQAVARRGEPLLLAAGAGSGKTSVLVERFVRAVREDGIAPGRILAITFTERAAGELRERVRGRFAELGEREAARDTEAAFVSTFHGFCARLLRVHPLSRALDPEFAILDEGWPRACAGRPAAR